MAYIYSKWLSVFDFPSELMCFLLYLKVKVFIIKQENVEVVFARC